MRALRLAGAAVAVLVFSACGSTSSTSSTIAVPHYTTAKEKDKSWGAAKRYEYDVVVDGKPTHAQLDAIASEVVQKAKDEHPLNAVFVFFFEKKSEISAGNGYTLGRAQYAPGGDWGNAADVQTGDYSTMKLTMDYGSATGL